MKGVSDKTKAAICLTFCVVSWASAFVGIRIGLKGYSPGSVALLRYLIASMGMLFLYLFFSKRDKPALKDMPLIFFTGVVGFGIYNIALNYGEITVSSGITGFIISQMPVIVTLLAPLLLKEKIAKSAWVGLGVSVVGVGLIAIAHRGDGSGSSLQGNLDLGIWYLIIAVFCGAIYAVCNKILTPKYHPIELTAYTMWSGTFILLFYTPTLWTEVKTVSMSATLACVYLGAFPGFIGYLAWSYALRYMPASRASNYLFLMPLVATGLGWLLLGEVPKLLALCGGVVALVGAIIATQYKGKGYKKTQDMNYILNRQAPHE
ncbi:MAG TPA: DMT family transporter [Gammaproteobacteria bacterium]|nr:DMT family transporter [Gammaproteobacteria bacterium]